MPTVTTAPGVYIEEDASPAISVSQGATAVPLFIGRFKPLDNQYSGKITRVSSWLDFCQKFSPDVGIHSASVEIVSTPPATSQSSSPTESGSKKSKAALKDGEEDKVYTYSIKSTSISETESAAFALQLYFQNGGGACYVYPVADVEAIKQPPTIESLADGPGDITLFVVPENDEKYQTAVYGPLLASLEKNKGYFLLADSSDGSAPSGIGDSGHIAVYYPPLIPASSPLITLEGLDESKVAVKGYADEAKSTVATLAELKKVKDNKASTELAAQILSALSGATFPSVTVPASAVMAGVFCKTDSQRGVWKAPANVALNGITDVSVRVTDDAQGKMNQAGINAIRYFSDRGVVVWGARTLHNDDNWRYIPVRRLFDAAERDIKKALRPMVFEPNNQLTWKRVQAAIDHYLYSLWRQGALAGNKAEEAYFVRIGKDITMTTDDINQGKMIVQVGMAAVRPAEFIILQFTQNMTQ